jgi:ribose 5-phosphate isomerase A
VRGTLGSPKTKQQLDSEKEVVARAAACLVKPGMKVGLGSGSTSQHFIRLLGERVQREGFHIEAVASSKDSEALARAVGIALTEPTRGLRLDLAIDGADEIGPDLSLIKGGGGAHLREKVVVAAADYFLVIADSSKLVKQLGSFPVPLEVVPFALPWVIDRIEEMGAKAVLRLEPEADDRPCMTDQQNYLLDAHFGSIDDPARLATTLEKIPGIIAHGLFIGYARSALVAQNTTVMVLRVDGTLGPFVNCDQLP